MKGEKLQEYFIITRSLMHFVEQLELYAIGGFHNNSFLFNIHSNTTQYISSINRKIIKR